VPNAPESLAAVETAMAHTVTTSERRAGEAEATTNAAPRAVIPHAEEIARAAWAYAMPDVAFPGFDDLGTPPPAEPCTGSMRAAALSTTASQLISGAAPPRR
jgi:hypothetical protein